MSLSAYRVRAENAADGPAPLSAATTSLPGGVALDLLAAIGGDTQGVEGFYSKDGVIAVDATRNPALAATLADLGYLAQAAVPDGLDAPAPLVVDPRVAGLSGEANEGLPVDDLGAPLAPPAAPAGAAAPALAPKIGDLRKPQLLALARQAGHDVTDDLKVGDLVDLLGGPDTTADNVKRAEA